MKVQLENYIYLLKRYYRTAKIRHDIYKCVVYMDKLEADVEAVIYDINMNTDALFTIDYNRKDVKHLLAKMLHDACTL